ncbi:phospholipase D family protein [bacterium]|nr:phospholipase D family protein [bacterium]
MRNKKTWIVVLAVLLLCAVSSFAKNADDIRVVFDPDLRSLIRGAITQSEKSVDVEVFKMTDRGVIADLGNAAGEGVAVRVILCPTQKSNQKAANKLLGTGAKVRWYPVTKKNQIMHVKMGLFDMQRLIFGSPNWTYWGLTIHHEGVLDISLPAVVDEMQGRFEVDWEKSKPARLL